MISGMSAAVEEHGPEGDRRMTIGEHLEELRGCLLRSLVAFVLACLVCIWPAKYLLELIARPYVLALHRHEQATSFLQTSPTEVILIYIKVVIFAGLVVSGPYVIHQIWSFIAVGLYRHEKKWVYRLLPVSVALFIAGVVFMYLFVLLLALKFLVGFSNWLPLPQPEPTALEEMILGGGTASRPAAARDASSAPRIPALLKDPEDAPADALWFNLRDRRLKLRSGDETFSVQLQRDRHRSLVTTHFKIGDYLTFVLVLTIAFGLAFQMPLVVVFLVRSGIVAYKTLSSYRKVVILIIVVIAGIIAPADLLSHVLLSGSMYALFEVGLFFARRKPRKEAQPAG